MHDLRMAPAAIVCWSASAWLVTAGSATALIASLLSVVIAAAILRWAPASALPLVLVAVCLSAVAASCAWRLTAVESSPVAGLADQHRLATMDVEVRRDARPFTQHGQESAVVQIIIRRAVSRDVDVRVRDHATAFVEGAAEDLVVGRQLVILGRLSPSEASNEVALIDVVRRGPTDRAPWWWEASEHVREGVRRSVSPVPVEPRALVPALVDGDD